MPPNAGRRPSAASPHQRKHSVSGPSTSAVAGSSPSTFFITSESMLDNSQTPTASMNEATFGIKSAEDEQASKEDKYYEREEGRRRSTIIAPRVLARDTSKDSLSMGSFAGSSSSGSSPSRPFLKPRINTANALSSKVPSLFQSPILGTSEPGSPKSMSMSSFRQSDDGILDDQTSQAVMSDSEDEVSPEALDTDNTTAPQFIMPSIMMPSRRPFSDRGNALGRLKILLAGGSGVGKTSLIKSIVQTCEDIVHIDASIPTKLPSKDTKRIGRSSQVYNKTRQISEMYASTKAYPNWWSELEQSNVLRRRKSGDGTVLERNICFVDTPGYDAGTSILEGMDKVLRYIELQMTKTLDIANADDSEVLNLLGGGGGSQVDVVLYLLDHPLKPADLEFMKQLSSVTNLVPILGRVDAISAGDLERVKASIADELSTSGLKPFPLNPQASPYQIYTVCSSPSKDLENMDASLLMQSDYIQPLQASELSTVIEHLFVPETIRKLKYFSAKKIIQTRQTPRASTIVSSPLRSSMSPTYTRSNTVPSPLDSNNTSHALISRHAGTMTYNQAAVTDHTLREERLARIHLANWATNLQRSLTNERLRYEAIAKAERAEWLKARLGECVFEQDLPLQIEDPKLEPTFASKSGQKSIQDAQELVLNRRTRRVSNDPADPLGLLRWRDDLSSHGILLLKVMGGAGVVGALGTFLFLTMKHWTESPLLHSHSSFFGGWWDTFD